MPKVPQYTREVAPSVQYDRTAGLQGQAMQNTASQFGELVTTLDRNRMLTQHNNAQTAFLKGLDEIDKKYQQDADYFTLEERAGKDVEDLKKQVLKGAPDPRVTESLGRAFDEHGIRFMGAIRNHAVKGQASAGWASTMDAIEALENDYVKASPNERQGIEKRIFETLDAAGLAGQKFPEQIQEEKQRAAKRLQVKVDNANIERVQEDIMRLNPVKVRAELEKKEKGAYPDIQGGDRRILINQTFEREAQLKKTEKAGTFKTDPRVELEISRLIYHPDGPQITPEQLYDRLGKDVSVDTYEHFNPLLSKELELEPAGIDTKSVRRATFKTIDSMVTQGTMGMGEGEKIKQACVAAWDKGKPKNGAEALALIEPIVQPHKEDNIKKIIDALSWGSWVGKAAGLAVGNLGKKGEGKPLAQKGEPEFLPDLPPAKQYTGKFATDTATGKKYKSDGVKWVEVK